MAIATIALIKLNRELVFSMFLNHHMICVIGIKINHARKFSPKCEPKYEPKNERQAMR